MKRSWVRAALLASALATAGGAVAQQQVVLTDPLTGQQASVTSPGLGVVDAVSEQALGALVAALGSPIPSNKHCQTNGLAASLVCGTPGVALIDWSVRPDATLYASGYFVFVFDAVAPPGSGAVAFEKCYQVPANAVPISQGAAYGAGGVTQSTGLVLAVSVGANCQTFTPSTHADIMASYQ